MMVMGGIAPSNEPTVCLNRDLQESEAVGLPRYLGTQWGFRKEQV